MKKRIVLLAFIWLWCYPFVISAQDSIPAKQSLAEEKELKFQEYFFKALSEKSIRNYQKAIESLEQCNEIFPEDVTVLFEFSKNYYALNKTIEAKVFIQRALAKDPSNLWMLKHFVAIYKKERDFQKAIEIQKKVVAIDPKMREELVRLYYLNRNYNLAIEEMNALQNERGLSKNLQRLKESLIARKSPAKKILKTEETLSSLIQTFENDNSSFEILKKLLEKVYTEDKKLLEKYSNLGIELFPAQPFAYLMRAKSLLEMNKAHQALSFLESGIDFVIDNPGLESEFYLTMAKAYDGLGNSVKAQEYRAKAKKIKAVK